MWHDYKRNHKKYLVTILRSLMITNIVILVVMGLVEFVEFLEE